MTNEAENPLVEQTDALLHAAGLHVRDGDLVCLRVRGADRIDYLHRMLTQDVASLTPGEATYACLLTVQGRILGDLLLWDQGEEVVLEMDGGARRAVQPVLEKYVITEDVTIEDVTDRRHRIAILGPDAPALVESAGMPVPPHGHHGSLGDARGAVPARILRFDRRGLPCFELSLDPLEGVRLPEVVALLSSAPECGSRAWAAACVHAAIPRFGRELGEDVLFNEAGLEEAVSWHKGCYPGQEPVVMAKHRGRPPRLLVKLDLEDARHPARGSRVLAGDEEVGRVTSAAPAVGPRPAAALAYVKYAHAKAGRAFAIEGGGHGVVRLPTIEA